MSDIANRLKSIESYFADVEQFDWFAEVGCRLPESSRIQVVNSWKDAYMWTFQPISQWCDLEAKQRIYRHMSASHYEHFVNWNEVAKSILPRVEDLVASTRQCFPQDAPQGALDWFQCQLIGTSMELCYAEFIESSLFREQLEFYRRGHFPCGWHVESESKFPDQALLVVF